MVSVESDPVEIANSQSRRRLFDRNAEWLQANARDVYRKYRGKFICISEEEVFEADTPEGALQAAELAHPDDLGRFLRYVPRERLHRI